MKHKKVLSFVLCFILLLSCACASFESIAAKAVSAESFAEAIEQLVKHEPRKKKCLRNLRKPHYEKSLMAAHIF